MDTLSPAVSTKYADTMKELLDYAEFAGLGPHNVMYSFAALQKIIENDLCDGVTECVGYATLLGQHIATCELVSKYVDVDNLSCETDPLSLYTHLYKNDARHRKTYFDYRSQQGKMHRSIWENFVVNALGNTQHKFLVEISDSTNLSNPGIITDVLQTNLQGRELAEYQRKAERIKYLPSMQRVKSWLYDKTRAKEFLIKQVFGSPREKYHILALGDSITAGSLVEEFESACVKAGVSRAATYFDSAKHSYVTYPAALEYLINRSIGIYDKKPRIHRPSGAKIKNPDFPKTKVVNLGETGATSSMVSNNYHALLELQGYKTKPIHAIILAGTNDIGLGKAQEMDVQSIYAEIAANIGEIVSLSKQKNIRPHVCKITPAIDPEHNREYIVPVNKKIEEYFNRTATPVIDTYTPLLNAAEDALDGMYSAGDGLHLNQTGNTLLAASIAKAVVPEIFEFYVALEKGEMHRIKRWWDFMLHHKPKKSVGPNRWHSIIHYEKMAQSI